MADTSIINSPIRIVFDNQGRPEDPTLILAKRNGKKIGVLNAKEIDFKDVLRDAFEINFRLYKYNNDQLDPMWEDVKNFRLVWWKEQDAWFEIKVDVDEATETIKTVYGVQLGKAELSEIKLYDIQINTESDIERDDYIPTTLYNEDEPEASLLDRILEKAPHYSIKHVDDSIKDIQRTFEFNNVSIYDAFQQVAEEIQCLFIYSPVPNSVNDGNIKREISVYDALSHCSSCGYRGEQFDVCPECGSTNIVDGYGDDTTIFITAGELHGDELANNISLSSDTDSIRNCYKLDADDDLMTATIRNANPNGSDYIWFFPEDMLSDVSPELRTKLLAYTSEYDRILNDEQITLDSGIVSNYNILIDKYQEFDPDLETIQTTNYGYHSIMKILYDTLDFDIYLSSALMPDVSMEDTSADDQIELLEDTIDFIAVVDDSNIAVETASNAYRQMAKALLDFRYDIKVVSASLTTSSGVTRWEGTINVTNVSDEDDTATTTVLVPVTDDYEEFIKQKIEKVIGKTKVNDTSVSALFAMEYNDFVLEIKKYCKDSLSSFESLCQSVIDIIVEQGITAGGSWAPGNSIYDDIYMPYKRKLGAIETELAVREGEIKKINALTDSIRDISDAIKTALNLKDLLGDTLWEEFSSYRREDIYEDNNYSSDNLSNAEMFASAMEFIERARNDIKEKYDNQYSISTSLKNLLHMPKFLPITDHFSIGNWMRIVIDGRIYKLRLTEYTINFDDFSEISVVFSQTALAKSSSTNGILTSLQKSIYQATQKEIDKQASDTSAEIRNITNIINNLLDDVNRGALNGENGLPGKDGRDGTGAVAYSLSVSCAAIVRGTDTAFTPSTLTLTGRAQTENEMSNYAGRFVIEKTTDYSTWTTIYTSGSDEATKSFDLHDPTNAVGYAIVGEALVDDTLTPRIMAFRCSLYRAGGTTTLVDQQTVPVVADGKDGKDGTAGRDGVDGRNGTNGTNGTNGRDATAYSLIVTPSAIVKDEDGVLSPSSITLTARYKTGTSNPYNYSGRFRIESSVNNSDWITIYASSSNESTKTYSVPSDAMAIRCSLFQAGGTTYLLDQQTIPVVSDGVTTTVYTLEPSHAAIVKHVSGSTTTFNPTIFKSNNYYKSGGNSKQLYSGYMKIETTTNNSTWSTAYNPTDAIASLSYTIPSGWDDVVAMRVSLYSDSNKTQLLDQQTVPMVLDGADGADGDDAYTIILTNESHTFAGDKTSALPNQTVASAVIGYKGGDLITPRIESITGAPTGMSTSITHASGSSLEAFAVSVDSTMQTRSGVLTLTITADGHTFTKDFSYSLALAGDDGNDAYTIMLTDENHTFVGDTEKALPEQISFDVVAYKGATVITPANTSISWSTPPTGMTITRTNNTNTINVGVSQGSSQMTTASGSITFTIGVDSKTFTKKFTYSIAFAGEDGDGDDGYTVMLSNENHTFVGDDEKALPSEITFDVVSYKGTDSIAPTSLTYSGNPTGMQVLPSADNRSVTIKVSQNGGAAMTSANGVVTFSITVDGKVFTKKFTYSIAFAGQNGANGEDAIIIAFEATKTKQDNIMVANITAHVWKGATEITDTTTPSISDLGVLNWYSSTDVDGQWTEQPIYTGRTLTVSPAVAGVIYDCRLVGDDVLARNSISMDSVLGIGSIDIGGRNLIRNSDSPVDHLVTITDCIAKYENWESGHAYLDGDKVKYNELNWISTADNNTSTPGSGNWTQITEIEYDVENYGSWANGAWMANSTGYTVFDFPTWQTGTTYSSGALVSHNHSYWRSTANNNTTTPGDANNPSNWTEIFGFSPIFDAYAGTSSGGVAVYSSVSNSKASSNNTLGAFTLISGAFSNTSSANHFAGIVNKGYNASTTNYNYNALQSNSPAVFQYAVPFSIPSTAVVSRLYMRVSGHCQDHTSSEELMCVQLKSNDVALSEKYNFKSYGSTSNSIQNIEATKLPTPAQLSNLVVECTLGYRGGAIFGATVYVEYYTPTDDTFITQSYMPLIDGKTYTLSYYARINGDHMTYESSSPVAQSIVPSTAVSKVQLYDAAIFDIYPEWDSSKTYSKDDRVSYNNKYWVSTSNANRNTPGGTWWDEVEVTPVCFEYVEDLHAEGSTDSNGNIIKDDDGRVIYTNEWRRYEHTFVYHAVGSEGSEHGGGGDIIHYNSGGTDSHVLSVRFGIVGGGWIDYCAMQLEVGSIATDWNQAPEDAVDFADRIHSDIDGINGRIDGIVGDFRTEFDDHAYLIDALDRDSRSMMNVLFAQKSYAVYNSDYTAYLDTNDLTQVRSALIIDTGGIGFWKYDESANPPKPLFNPETRQIIPENLQGSLTSVWTLDGKFDAEAIEVVNLSASSIAGGCLVIGGKQEVEKNGIIEVYGDTKDASDLIARIDRAGIKVFAKDGTYVLMDGNVGFAGYDPSQKDDQTYTSASLEFPAWSSSKQYGLGERVYYNGKHWMSTVTGNINSQPRTDSANWKIADLKIFWADKDEFHMRKAVVEEEITLSGKMRFISITIINNGQVVNDGIGLVAL